MEKIEKGTVDWKQTASRIGELVLTGLVFGLTGALGARLVGSASPAKPQKLTSVDTLPFKKTGTV
ncbi:MAG: hypothetical protein A2583_13995 [Bdellovibrionales bacterium RIFOXYD1_FULL_53_11]|nr:MAG: hypothetical protein A2583_13995 [Bdellovibrionales bacterium RIFOXYD1_FULL_53_11]